MTTTVLGCLMLAAAIPASVQADGPSNLVPELTLSYTDPDTGERVVCGEGCRRLTVPAGVELEVRVRIHGGGDAADSAAWDLWLNQPNHPFPGSDLAPCRDTTTGRYDRGCWQALADGVDRAAWEGFEPDAVCVPGFNGGTCRDTVVRFAPDPEFEGARRRGVYHLAIWVNRLSTVPEEDEFDNFVGPVRITVEPRPDDAAGESVAPPGVGVRSTVRADSPSVVVPSSAGRYVAVVVPGESQTSFTLTSPRSQSVLEFVPACAGKINVEVVQTGVYENVVVRVRKVSTDEVLIEAKGKGTVRLEGGVDNFDLMDDRTLEVVVTPGQGSRGVRGTTRVNYPARIGYMVDQPMQQ